MSVHLSQGGRGSHGVTESEFSLRSKLGSIRNRDRFLRDCIEEQVLPRSAPQHLYHRYKPFSNTAREYLIEARETLKHEAEEIRSKLRSSQLPHNLVVRLQEEDQSQKRKLERKLQHLCDNSKWKEIGRQDLIRNLSTHELMQTQKEALALGLKFKTNINNKKLSDYVGKNYDWRESDLENGFRQGVLVCCTVAAKNNSVTLPRRYVHALKELRDNSDIMITTADKGGGVVILDRSEYIRKMEVLLSDSNTYREQPEGQAQKEANKFNKDVRKVLRKSQKGKKLLHLLEEDPRIPRMKGLPKIHKPDVPMRPITSGIGSAPHRLAKHLAKPLSSAMGKISGAHLKNSSDLIGRLREVNFRDKRLVSFDVKSLFTNVPVDGAIHAIKKVLEHIGDEDLPVNRTDYMKLIELCIKFGSFSFNEKEYFQHEGLPMGSPLSAVAASLFMEALEKEHYNRIIPSGSKWYRYVDDCLLIVHKDTDIDALLHEMNNVHRNIQFTVEKEVDGSIPFLDTKILRTDDSVKFKVYRKPTNKDDFVHFLSAHDEKTKSGIIIGFYLRALRICDQEYLDEEIKYITDTFVNLGYPKGMLKTSLEKAVNIRQRRTTEERTNKRYLVVPSSGLSNALSRILSPTGLVIVNDTGNKIGDMVKYKETQHNSDNSIVYRIPCGGCESAYYGESYRGINNRLREHKADVRYHRTTNAIVNHIDDKNHLPEWEQAEVLEKRLTKQQRKVLEALYIATNKNLNQRTGDIKWTREAATMAMIGRRHDPGGPGPMGEQSLTPGGGGGRRHQQ